MTDIKNILPNDEHDEMSDEELMRYLSGNLPEEEKNAFERKMADSAFTNDALEGLESFTSKSKLNDYAKQLNHTLRHQLNTTGRNRQKKKIRGLSFGITAVALILILCILAYIVIRKMS